MPKPTDKLTTEAHQAIAQQLTNASQSLEAVAMRLAHLPANSRERTALVQTARSLTRLKVKMETAFIDHTQQNKTSVSISNCYKDFVTCL